MSIELVNGAVAFGKRDFTTTSGDNDNIDVNGGFLLTVTSNDNDALTGFIPCSGKGGELLFVVNVHPTNTLILKADDTGSDEAYRIRTSTNGNYTLEPFHGALLVYSDAVARLGWCLFEPGTL